MPTSKTKICPRGQKVLIRLTSPVSATQGKIIIPEVAQNRSTVGRVLAVGDGSFGDEYSGVWPPDWLSVGQLVLVGRYAGTEIKLEDQERDKQDTFIVGIQEILATVEEP